MKKLLALLLTCVLLLSLAPAAFAQATEATIEAEVARLNIASNTIAVLLPDEDYFQLIAPDGQVLVPTNEKFTEMRPLWDCPFFTVTAESDDDLHSKGLIAGDGTLVVPPKYYRVEFVSEAWQLGLLVVPCEEDGADFKINDSTAGTESYCSIDKADVYYRGECVGSLSHDEYDGTRSYAYGAYLAVGDRDGGHVFYNSKLEKSPFEATYFEEFSWDYNTNCYYHQGSGEKAFTPDCSLDPADLASPYLFEEGVLYDIKGKEIAKFSDDYWVDKFVDGYANVELGAKKGVLTEKGELLVPVEYDDVGYFEPHPFRYGYTSAVKDGMFGFLDAKGQPSIEFAYSEDEIRNYVTFATYEDEDDAIVVISAAVGELPEHYADVEFNTSDGSMAFLAERADGTFGAVDLFGNILVPFGNYESMTISLDGTTALVELEEDQYVIYTFDLTAPTA